MARRRASIKGMGQEIFKKGRGVDILYGEGPDSEEEEVSPEGEEIEEIEEQPEEYPLPPEPKSYAPSTDIPEARSEVTDEELDAILWEGDVDTSAPTTPAPTSTTTTLPTPSLTPTTIPEPVVARPASPPPFEPPPVPAVVETGPEWTPAMPAPTDGAATSTVAAETGPEWSPAMPAPDMPSSEADLTSPPSITEVTVGVPIASETPTTTPLPTGAVAEEPVRPEPEPPPVSGKPSTSVPLPAEHVTPSVPSVTTPEPASKPSDMGVRALEEPALPFDENKVLELAGRDFSIFEPPRSYVPIDIEYTELSPEEKDKLLSNKLVMFRMGRLRERIEYLYEVILDQQVAEIPQECYGWLEEAQMILDSNKLEQLSKAERLVAQASHLMKSQGYEVASPKKRGEMEYDASPDERARERAIQIMARIEEARRKIDRENISANPDITAWAQDQLEVAQKIVDDGDFQKFSHAERLVVDVSFRLDRAHESTKQSRRFAVFAILWGALWFGVFVFIMFFGLDYIKEGLARTTVFLNPSLLDEAGGSLEALQAERLLFLDQFILAMVFGGIGGVSAIFYYLLKYTSKREYDAAYNLTYVAKPINGMILGTVAYLIVYVIMKVLGFFVIGQQAVTEGQTPAVDWSTQSLALLYAMSFAFGFRENLAFEFFDKVMKKVFGMLPGMKEEETTTETTEPENK